ncbi:MAG: cytochrome c biogenesis protein CcdA [Candidatus Microbacterium phytovorans]|uniref:Cytochrome c biogenesis protein CcdA n=1 Tax=Candidatus Microbacterium phytovorans TaxID=3121374 RepID=A0AAJ5VZQ4_9MICO|nr:cytochrome c biogenesis protein CcdA [Microbacterium sp.]WEK12593.1 MAG: cytochrome c biogenesis protein CcdA [Microbacterium sp.]
MNPGEVVFDGALWIAIPIAALAGLVSFLSPCVLPLVPGYLGFLGGATSARPAREGRGRLLLGVALFILGFTLVFVAMGVLAGTLGRFFLQYGDLLTRVLGVVVIVMGLVFVGVFGVAQRTLKPQVRSGLGLVGAPLLGIAMGIGWAPCIGPTYTAILSISLTQADPWRAVVLAVAYSLGLGIPFLLIALGVGWAARSTAFFRRHIRVVNIVGGVLLIVLGLLMVTGVWTAVMSSLTGVIGSVQLPL